MNKHLSPFQNSPTPTDQLIHVPMADDNNNNNTINININLNNRNGNSVFSTNVLQQIRYDSCWKLSFQFLNFNEKIQLNNISKRIKESYIPHWQGIGLK